MPKPNVREQIVDAGLDQFHRAGFNGSSVDDITRAAGVPKGSFYNHFDSKEDLAVDVIERYAQSAPDDELRDRGRPAIKRLRAHFARLAADFIESGYTRGCLLGNLTAEMADHSAAIRAKLDAMFSDWTDLITSVIREGQDAGEITTSVKAQQLAGFLLSAWQGTLIRIRSTKNRGLLREFNTVAFSVLLPPRDTP
jgi:TetR/AcrR family transcriptional regulator, transcriptional repressor for nem operon